MSATPEKAKAATKKALDKPKKDKPAKAVKVVEKKRKVGKPRNYDLGNGVYRFSRTKMFHKKAKYLFVGKDKKNKDKKPVERKKKTPVTRTVVKKIGGDKNGQTRVVSLKKNVAYYPTADKLNKHPTKKRFRQHDRNIRKTLSPGKVVILLAGRHKGKRVILLKILKSGLLLVTGPLSINGCPMRRVSQNYVIATGTRVNIKDIKIPIRINDSYFNRARSIKPKKAEGDIFAKKVTGYVVRDERKRDQKNIDKAVIGAIKKRPDGRLFRKYLAAMFGLKRTQYPHRIKF